MLCLIKLFPNPVFRKDKSTIVVCLIDASVAEQEAVSPVVCVLACHMCMLAALCIILGVVLSLKILYSFSFTFIFVDLFTLIISDCVLNVSLISRKRNIEFDITLCSETFLVLEERFIAL